MRKFGYLLFIIGLASIAFGIYIYPNYINVGEENIVVQDTVEEDIEEESDISETEALKIGKELWDYAFSTYWKTEPAWTSDEESIEEDQCNTTLDEIKKKYSENFIYVYTDEYENFSEDSLDKFIPADCTTEPRKPLESYKETELKVRDINEKEITFHATSRYDSAMITQDFIIEKEGNTWLIKRFFLPN